MIRCPLPNGAARCCTSTYRSPTRSMPHTAAAPIATPWRPAPDALGPAHRAGAYRDGWAAAAIALGMSSITPSARVLQEMAQSYANSFPSFALTRSLQYKKELLELPLATRAQNRFESMATESLQEQQRIE